MKAVAYYRTSGATGKANAGDGMEVQRSMVREYARENDIEIVAEYTDDGISGAEEKLEKHTGLMDLLGNLNGQDLVLVKSTDRLWRDDISRALITRELKGNKKDVRAVDNPDFTLYAEDPTAYLINAILESLDTYQRMEVSLKLTRARRNRVRRTKQKAAGKAPLGYRWHEKRLIVDDNADVVAGAWKEYMKEQSTLKVRDYFQRHGIKISQPGTLGLLKNDFYVGMVRYGDVEEKGAHEPLTNKVIFGKVQAQLKRNRRG